MNVRLLPAAEADITNAYDWYAERNRAAAGRFEQAVNTCVSRIAEHPESCRKVYRDFRRVILNRFPYVLFYFCAKDEVVVFGCFHGHRDPDVWKSRLDG